jgi:hypothetical protein
VKVTPTLNERENRRKENRRRDVVERENTWAAISFRKRKGNEKLKKEIKTSKIEKIFF